MNSMMISLNLLEKSLLIWIITVIKKYLRCVFDSASFWGLSKMNSPFCPIFRTRQGKPGYQLCWLFPKLMTTDVQTLPGFQSMLLNLMTLNLTQGQRSGILFSWTFCCCTSFLPLSCCSRLPWHWGQHCPFSPRCRKFWDLYAWRMPVL